MDSNTLTLLVVISLTPIVLLVIIAFLTSKLKKQNKEISNLKLEISNQSKIQKSIFKFMIGSKALLNDFSLSSTNSDNQRTEFSVDYEVEVVDISESEIKVKAIDFVGNDKFSIDPKNKAGILQFMQDKWISKSEAQLIMDESHNRQSKLEELGI